MFLFPTFAPHKKRGNAQVTENPLSKCNDETMTTPVGRGVAVVFFGLKGRTPRTRSMRGCPTGSQRARKTFSPGLRAAKRRKKTLPKPCRRWTTKCSLLTESHIRHDSLSQPLGQKSHRVGKKSQPVGLLV